MAFWRSLLSPSPGLEGAGNSPEAFADLMHADIEKWKHVTRDADIEPQ